VPFHQTQGGAVDDCLVVFLGKTARDENGDGQLVNPFQLPVELDFLLQMHFVGGQRTAETKLFHENAGTGGHRTKEELKWSGSRALTTRSHGLVGDDVEVVEVCGHLFLAAEIYGYFHCIEVFDSYRVQMSEKKQFFI
jgi:hypothetical protein